MREDALLTGTLEPTNEAYAIAKIAGIKMCASYNVVSCQPIIDITIAELAQTNLEAGLNLAYADFRV